MAQQSGQMQDGGTVVRWSYQPLSDAPSDSVLGVLDLHLQDAITQTPLRYKAGQLAAWLQRGRGALSDAELACSDKVRALASQGIGRRAEIDLNGWRLVTLNADRTIAFINPFVGLNNAKLESIVQLAGDIDSWVHQPKRLQLWVHTQQGITGELAKLDTHRREITHRVGTVGGASSLVLDADGSRVWLVSTQQQQLSAMDAAAQTATLQTTPAAGMLGAVAAPQHGIYSWHQNPSRLVFWQTDKSGVPQKMRQWSLPDQPVAARWGNQAQRLLVALHGGELVWINPDSTADQPERVVRIAPEDTGISSIEVFDDGRRAVWLNAKTSRAGMVDVATARNLVLPDIAPLADTIAFTDGFAYLHSTASAAATLFSLADLRAGRAQPVQVSTGSPANQASAGVRVASDPSQRGLLVANPVDGVVYQYGEGMMAPIGSYSNYRRSAVGVMVLDTSLSEVGPGHYRAALRSDKGGSYELVVSAVGPRMAACTALQLPAAQTALTKVSAPRVVAVLQDLRSAAGQANAPTLLHQVRVRLQREDETRQTSALGGVGDLVLLVFDRRNGWQQRISLKEVAPGIYGANVQLPNAGTYDWLVSSASQELPFHAGRLGQHEVGLP